MTTRAWQCVAGAALIVGTLSAAMAAHDPDPHFVQRAQTTTIDPHGTEQADERHQLLLLLSGSGLLAFGGVVLVGGVAGLGGLRIPGGISMTVGRSRLWYRTLRHIGTHRAPQGTASSLHR